ncbi:MAG: glycoside hydrolase family 9 protein [Lacipirellulaceae bacterium]
MQKSLYFYEAQQSGVLSPNNRVAWRGGACLTDGSDLGRDLSGGWFDAGDHWTANLTMAWSAMALATSAQAYPEAWTQSQQMDELLESLVHVNDYFLRCVPPPGVSEADPAFEVVIGCGGSEGVPPPNVHSIWAPAEVAHRLTNRPTFRLNDKAPGGDIPAAMAAAMAASAIVINEHRDALEGKNGFEDWDGEAYAARLIEAAERLHGFAFKYRSAEHNQGKALRSDGQVVGIGYRTNVVVDKLLAAEAWLAVWHRDRADSAAAQHWRDKAFATHQGEYAQEGLNDWWRDNGAGFFGKVAALVLLQLDPGNEAAHSELAHYCSRILEYHRTPGGLRLREPSAHEWGSLRHAANAAMIALYYSDRVSDAPELQGNAEWQRGRKPLERKQEWLRVGRHQIDYALGKNPYGRSYLVGFGNNPFNAPHHRGAHGVWAGFEHLIAKAPEYRPSQCRHVLYGALLGGPDNQDVFTCKRVDQEYIFQHPTVPAWGIVKPRAGYVFSGSDVPVQLVSNPQFNEVAIDYNAAFTAALAFLEAKKLGVGTPLPDTEFPPPVVRTDSDDVLTTDREFFATARVLAPEAPCRIEIKAYNRSRWPPRVTTIEKVRMQLDPALAKAARWSVVEDATVKISVVPTERGHVLLEVELPPIELFPGRRDPKNDDHYRLVVECDCNIESLRKHPAFAKASEQRESMLSRTQLVHGQSE